LSKCRIPESDVPYGYVIILSEIQVWNVMTKGFVYIWIPFDIYRGTIRRPYDDSMDPMCWNGISIKVVAIRIMFSIDDLFPTYIMKEE
jgi:hypothetical protein